MPLAARHNAMDKTTRKIGDKPRSLTSTHRYLLGETGNAVEVKVEVVRNTADAQIGINIRSKSDFDLLDFWLPLILFAIVYVLSFMGSFFWATFFQLMLVGDLFKRIQRRPSGRRVTGLRPPYSKKAWVWSFGVYFLFMPFLFFAAYLNRILVEQFYEVKNPLEFIEPSAIAAMSIHMIIMAHLLIFAIIFFQVVVMAPLTEELWFRGVGLTSFLKNGTHTSAMIWTSLIFGFMHGLSAALFASLAGFMFAFIRYRTGSLYCCMAVHATHNFIALLVAIYTAVHQMV